jgi:hypothetical protein
MTLEQVDHLFLHLKSGRVLCRLMNTIQPGAIRKINQQKIVFYERENIQKFTIAAITLGLSPEEVFSVDSLYDAKDLISVIRTILALKKRASTYKPRDLESIAISLNDQNINEQNDDGDVDSKQFNWSNVVVPLVFGVGGVGISLVAGITAPISFSVGVFGAAMAGGTKYWFGY